MKYIMTKDGKVYEVLHENAGFNTGHYVCSSLNGDDVAIECNGVEHHIKDCHEVTFISVDDVVKEAETIDELRNKESEVEAVMSKGLEAFEKIASFANDCHHSLEFLEEYELVIKELKALEIIRQKGLDLSGLRYHQDLFEYNRHRLKNGTQLTQEEYDLLKEILL